MTIFTSAYASSTEFNLGSYPFCVTKAKSPVRERWSCSGLPNFSQSQISSSFFPGAWGLVKLSDKLLKAIVVGTLIYSTIPYLVYELKLLVSTPFNAKV